MPKSRARPSVTACIASDRLGAPPGIAFEQDRRAGVGDRTAVGQHRGERLRIPEPEVNTLPRQRMYPVGRVADKREAQGDGRRHPQEAQRKARRRRDRTERAERIVAGRGHTHRELVMGQFQELRRQRVGGRPDDRNALIRQRQPGEHAAVCPEPLVRASVMRALAGEVGDDRSLTVVARQGGDAGLLAHPRRATVGADDEAPGQRAPVSELQRAGVRQPRERFERGAADHLDACAANERQQRGAQRALLDDPRQRTLALLVGREGERRAAVTFDAHRFDRRDALRRQRLPRADRAQERRTAGADRVDARVPHRFVRVGHGDRRAVGERHREAGAREGRGKRKADQTRAGNHDIVGRPREWRNRLSGRS